MKLLFAIALGGASGALGRHFVGMLAVRIMGHGFPWGTLAVNIAGSLALGALIEVLALAWSPSEEMRAFLTVGLLGAFTTFSAFSMETVLLYERGTLGLTAIYVAASVVLSVGALMLGMRVLRLVL